MMLTKTCYHETHLQEIINLNIRFLKTILKVDLKGNNFDDAIKMHHICSSLFYSFLGGGRN